MYEFGETVIHHPFDGNARDAHGNRTPSWGDGTPVEGVAVGPTSSAEDNADGDRVTTGITLYVPFETTVSVRDRFEIRGEMYDVVGLPLAYRNPFTGWTPGATVNVRRTTG